MSLSSWKRTAAFTASALTAAGGVCTAIYSRYWHPFHPRVVYQVVPLPRNHGDLAGLTVAFVTDTHVGPHFAATNLLPTIETVEAARPDLVIFGGDFISESPRFLKDVQEPVTRMANAAKLGAFAVMGNHDLANIRARVMDMLAPTGVRVLTNESVPVDTRHGTLWLTGIDDALLGRVDLPGAFDAVPPGAANLAIWHEADRAEEVLPYAPFLMLSGHSHGGQVRLPVIGAVATPKLGKRYVWGPFQLEDTLVYVASGIGMYRPPVRFNCPPEVAIFTLVA